jgi:hypothetical protein
MPDTESEQIATISRMHKAARPKQESTLLGICEWGWQYGLITFTEMLALIDYLRETGELELAR